MDRQKVYMSGGGYRYSSFDTFKTIAALMVVILHFPLRGTAGDIIGALSRIGVPFFFMVSGFFSYNEKKTDREQRKKYGKGIIKYLGLIIGIVFVYTFKPIIKCIQGQMTIARLLEPFMTLEFIIANFGANVGFMWFVRALLYINIIFLFCGRYIISFLTKRASVYFMSIIWILDILLIKYSNILFRFDISEPWSEIVTKFIGTAVLYFLIGLWIRIHESEISGKLLPISRKLPIALTIVLILNIAEYLILTAYDVNKMPANYFFTLPLAVLIFLLLFADNTWGNETAFSFIGEKMSMYIYYWHGLLGGSLLASLWGGLGLTEIIYRNPLFVYLEALVLGLCIYCIKNLLNRIIRCVLNGNSIG